MVSQKLIAVVDDDENVRTIVRTILVSAGYVVEAFESGADFLRELKKLTPDLAILDIMMPEMSGYELVVRMKQNSLTQNIPIMFLSAKGDSDDLITGYGDYGVDYYITKPFSAKQILSGISMTLGI